MVTYINYGNGTRFDEREFEPVRNRFPLHAKPEGGLWGSPLDSRLGWKHIARVDKYLRKTLGEWFTFAVRPDARILTVDSQKDLVGLKFLYIGEVPVLDYEDFAGRYDGLLLTFKGMLETRASSPGLWGWDCESIFVCRREVVIPLGGGRSTFAAQRG